jgi:hypothetical protein
MGGGGIQREVPCSDGAWGTVGIERWRSAGTVPLATAQHTAKCTNVASCTILCMATIGSQLLTFRIARPWLVRWVTAGDGISRFGLSVLLPGFVCIALWHLGICGLQKPGRFVSLFPLLKD